MLAIFNLVVFKFEGAGELRVWLERWGDDERWRGTQEDVLVASAPFFGRRVVEASDWRGFVHRPYRVVAEVSPGGRAWAQSWLSFPDGS